MSTAIIRWSIYLFALLLAGPAAGTLMLMARASDGGPGSPLVCHSPIIGIGAALGAVAIALIVGLLSIRLIGLPHAMTASGYVLAWAAWRSASVDQLIRTAGDSSPLVTLALEGALIGVAGLVCALALHRLSPRAKDEKAPTLNSLFGKHTLLCIVVGTIAGGVAAWLIASTPLKGQAIFGAIAGGVFAAAACRLVDYESPFPVMFVPIAVLAIVGPLTGLILAGSGGVVAASYKGVLFPLANISPTDWIAGGMLGIPIGVSWAGSMIEKRHPEAIVAGTVPMARS